jgi:hypothetical protein
MGYHYKYKEYIYRHMYPKKSSAFFTYHKYPDTKGGFLDDGTTRLQNAKYISLNRYVKSVHHLWFGLSALQIGSHFGQIPIRRNSQRMPLHHLEILAFDMPYSAVILL